MKMNLSKEARKLIEILNSINVLFLLEWEQNTVSGHTIFFVTIKSKTWTFECDKKGYWQYKFGTIMFSLNNDNEILLLSERIKTLKP